MLFISKLSTVTVFFFFVKNGFGVSWKGRHRNFKRFWSLNHGRSYYVKVFAELGKAQQLTAVGGFGHRCVIIHY